MRVDDLFLTTSLSRVDIFGEVFKNPQLFSYHRTHHANNKTPKKSGNLLLYLDLRMGAMYNKFFYTAPGSLVHPLGRFGFLLGSPVSSRLLKKSQ